MAAAELAAAEDPRAAENPELQAAKGVATLPITAREVEEEASRRATCADKGKCPTGATDCVH